MILKIKIAGFETDSSTVVVLNDFPRLLFHIGSHVPLVYGERTVFSTFHVSRTYDDYICF